MHNFQHAKKTFQQNNINQRERLHFFFIPFLISTLLLIFKISIPFYSRNLTFSFSSFIKPFFIFEGVIIPIHFTCMYFEIYTLKDGTDGPHKMTRHLRDLFVKKDERLML